MIMLPTGTMNRTGFVGEFFSPGTQAATAPFPMEA